MLALAHCSYHSKCFLTLSLSEIARSSGERRVEEGCAAWSLAPSGLRQLLGEVYPSLDEQGRIEPAGPGKGVLEEAIVRFPQLAG